jgi:hypothetical protein
MRKAQGVPLAALWLLVSTVGSGAAQAQTDSPDCEARKRGLAAFDNPPRRERPDESQRSFYEAELAKFRKTLGGDIATAEKELRAVETRARQLDAELRRLEDALKNLDPASERRAQLEAQKNAKVREVHELSDDLMRLQAVLAGAAREEWAAYDKAMSAYKAATAAMNAALEAARREFEEEQRSIAQARERLKSRDRDSSYRQEVRAVREHALQRYNKLKAALLKHDCWAEVRDFITNTLEPRIFRLQPQRTAARSDADEDDLDMAQLGELPASDDQRVSEPRPASAADRIVGTWSGAFKRNDTGATGGVQTVFTLDKGRLGGWHYQESWVIEGASVSGNVVTFAHVYGECRAHHTFTIASYEARQARSEYSVKCPRQGGHTGTITYGK